LITASLAHTNGFIISAIFLLSSIGRLLILIMISFVSILKYILYYKETRRSSSAGISSVGISAGISAGTSAGTSSAGTFPSVGVAYESTYQKFSANLAVIVSNTGTRSATSSISIAFNNSSNGILYK
jgi:hypothetical protein